MGKGDDDERTGAGTDEREGAREGIPLDLIDSFAVDGGCVFLHRVGLERIWRWMVACLFVRDSWGFFSFRRQTGSGGRGKKSVERLVRVYEEIS